MLSASHTTFCSDGVHRIDYCRYVMGLDTMPDTISCSGGKFFFNDDQQWPDTMLINYDYPGKILLYEMRLWSRPKLNGATEGAAIYGENGWIALTNDSWTAYDAAGKVVKQTKNKMGLVQQSHVRNFLDAIRSRQRDSLAQEVYSGHVSTVMCHAGDINQSSNLRLLRPHRDFFTSRAPYSCDWQGNPRQLSPPDRSTRQSHETNTAPSTDR
jgi:hypothetical protein